MRRMVDEGRLRRSDILAMQSVSSKEDRERLAKRAIIRSIDREALSHILIAYAMQEDREKEGLDPLERLAKHVETVFGSDQAKTLSIEHLARRQASDSVRTCSTIPTPSRPPTG